MLGLGYFASVAVLSAFAVAAFLLREYVLKARPIDLIGKNFEPIVPTGCHDNTDYVFDGEMGPTVWQPSKFQPTLAVTTQVKREPLRITVRFGDYAIFHDECTSKQLANLFGGCGLVYINPVSALYGGSKVDLVGFVNFNLSDRRGNCRPSWGLMHAEIPKEGSLIIAGGMLPGYYDFSIASDKKRLIDDLARAIGTEAFKLALLNAAPSNAGD